MSAGAGLAGQAARAVGWGAAGSVAKLVLQFGTQIMLARILGPEQYGLFAMGVLVVSLATFLADFGMAYGLIQKPQVSDDDLRCVFTWQILVGLVVATGVWAGSDLIARGFGEARAAAVVAALAPVCLLNALSAPSLNMLKRRMDFRSIQLSQVGSYVVGHVLCGLPLALWLGDVRALIVAWLVQSTVALVWAYAAVRHPLRPLWNTADRPAMLSVGLTVMVTNLLNWLLQNVDRAVVARSYTASSIGSYSAAYNLVYTPTTTLLGVIQPVFYSASARMDSADRGRQAGVYQAVLLVILLLLAPAYVAVAVLADPIIALLYGSAWRDAGALLTPFALAMPAFLIWGMSTPMLWAAGYARKEFRSQLPVLLLWLLVCAAASQGPVLWVAWGVAGLFFVRAATMVGQVCRVLSIPARDLWRTLRPGTLACVLVGLSCEALLQLGQLAGVGAVGLLLPVLALGLGGTLLLMAATLSLTVAPDVRPALRPVLARLPAALRRLRALRRFLEE